MGNVEYSVVDFTNTLQSSFIDSQIESDQRYAPRVVSNSSRAKANVLSVIKGELATCESFDFSVAFVTSSGIQVLVQILSELRCRGVRGRVLTSTLNNFNDPDALRKLLEFPNIETRIYQGNLHAKGYLFDKGEISTIIVGSSNLTHHALTCNKEWNVLFKSFPGGDMLHQMRSEYDEVWNDPNTVAVSEEWISGYEAFRKEVQAKTPIRVEGPAFRMDARHDQTGLAGEADGAEGVAEGVPCGMAGAQNGGGTGCPSAVKPREHIEAQPQIVPNKMQSLALDALALLHGRRERRALLVSATGTGKTYLSALDVRAQKPGRVLFVAHRHRILEASRESFERVLGSSYTYGIYGGGSAKPAASCVFAMVSTLSRHLDDFDSREFDYIIIDEAHRTGANSYRAILAHFEPSFFLGMTATPSRTDGYDVYGLFNHVIAFRITLQDALEEDMLAPFHYFGISDLEVDDRTVDDMSLFSKLTSQERVRHITSKIEEYTVEKSQRRGLIFCNRNEEAAVLSQRFNEAGYRTVAVSGADSDEERNRQIARLERGEIEYIFSVDIFNEGVDIPSLNQIVMLRRTDSAIVFVQQLGRGLRKCEGKEFTLVLDFIGNYQQNYLVPIALSGDRTYNKDTLRRVVKEGSTVIPGCSTISFDKVSEAQIFNALDKGRFGDTKLIRREYQELKQVLGRIPTLLDFDANESIDPNIIIGKFDSYAAFLQKYEPEAGLSLDAGQLKLLKFLSRKIANGKRREDLLVLKRLVESSNGFVEASRPAEGLQRRRHDAVAAMLCGSFSTSGEDLAEYRDDGWVLSARFQEALGNAGFRDQVMQAIDFGLARNSALYSERYKDTDFVLNAKYTREEICRLLRWEKEPNYQNIGGYFHDKQTNTFPVFVNYDKDPSISITTQYEDRFVSENTLIAISKSRRTLQSPEIQALRNARENGMRCFLFLRKNKNDKDAGTEFYFLGEMYPTGQFKPIVMRDTQAGAVEITYRLDVPVRADLYEYFLSDLDVVG
ncbi:MAG: DUF3427 domain-containing protein [Coriobacteriaceae bacterium]|nr:DUF3427 domain-containing protein [Coriobacteriaceae bacterium]